MINHKIILRRGNIVWHCLLGYSKVLEIRNDGISICNPINENEAFFIQNDNLGQIDSVDITVDILSKCGFRIYKKNLPESKKERMYALFHIELVFDSLHINEEKLWYQTSSVGHLSYSENPIKSLHHLQNLFLDRVGRELVFSSTEP